MKKDSMQRRFLYMMVAVVAVCAASCKTVPPKPQTVIDEMRPWLTEGKKPKVALVLSGGSARGFAHIGVIRILEQEKIPVDFIIGTSVGSLIGALYGSCKNSFELEWVAFELEEEDIFDFTLLSPTQGYVKGEQLVNFVREKVKPLDLEKLRVPLYITATDLRTGELVLFSSGPADVAIRASASIPVLFPPAVVDGRQLVDGGVVDNVPVGVARQKGADIVIAVDLTASGINYELNNIKDYAMQTISIMMAQNSRLKLKEADIVIRPNAGSVGIWDFSKKKKLMTLGMEATENSLPKIREIFMKWYEKQTVKVVK